MIEDDMVQVPMEHVRENAPLPFSVWDQHGNLLLAQGHRMNGDQVDSLRSRRALASQKDVTRWRRTLERHIAEVMRNNGEARTLDGFYGNPLVDRPARGMSIVRERPVQAFIPITDPISTWDSIHLRTSSLLQDAERSPMFLPRLEALCTAIGAMSQKYPDASLFLLIHQSSTTLENYSVRHALLTTAVGWLVASQMGLGSTEVDLVLRVGLTMNIGMTRLQNKLALQARPLTPEQRQAVLMHPLESVRILKACGVDDERWLSATEDHHETKDGRGYPSGKREIELSTVSKIIHQADLFAARLSPRTGRAALAANLAARKAYLGPDGQPDFIGASLVKKVGIYPPGSFVRLASGEIAIVVRRGLMANTPRVAAITGAYGAAYVRPVARETSDKAHEIRSSIAADTVKILINHERMIAMCH